MDKRAGNHKQSFVGHMRERSKLTCMNRGNVYSSEHCKLLNEFSTRYAANRPFKEHRQESTADEVQKKKEVNAVVQHAVNDILQKDENTKLSVRREPQEYDNTYSEIEEKELHELDKLSLDNNNKE